MATSTTGSGLGLEILNRVEESSTRSPLICILVLVGRPGPPAGMPIAPRTTVAAPALSKVQSCA
jgi:hypothetical protein